MSETRPDDRRTPRAPPNLTALGARLWALCERGGLLFLFGEQGPRGEYSLGSHTGGLHQSVTARDLAATLRAAMPAAAPFDGAREVGRLLWRLCRRARTAVLCFPVDADLGGLVGSEVSVDTVTREGTTGIVTRTGLVEALRAAAGEREEERRCPKCGATRPLSDFPRDAGRPSGRFPWCRTCNRHNVAAHGRRRKGRESSCD